MSLIPNPIPPKLYCAYAKLYSSRPFGWTWLTSTSYVLDGNALGLTATEAVRRRRPVELYSQPDTIIVSIGYPTTIADSPWSLQRGYDFQPPVCSTCPPATAPGVPSNADNFIKFIDDVLRPWVRNTVFPNANFNRDGLYGHSFGGLFVLYALLVRPDLFDVFMAASGAWYWNNEYILGELGPLTNPSNYSISCNTTTKPAFQISYGHLEQFPVKRRTETEAQYEARKEFLQFSMMSTLSNQLYNAIKNSTHLRDVSLHEYPFSDHAAVGAAAFGDGLDYFFDWNPQ